MAYIALYRKYRSQSFDEVQGQEAVTTTLRNQITAGKFGHAYLFYGARGCGKTSTARLLARALNCIAQDGPTANPCGQCRLCTAIRDGSCMDVIEMDAASETGIDDVREKVIENVQYAPGEARFKVYIIDEVHDLSAKAFDALLKTLEEPPAHVVFVLATTEYHKVPITVRSRCQGYQFKRGSVQDLGKSVLHVVTQEGYSADADAIESIARSAEGSWRDALSILEQVLAYSEGHLTADTVNRAVGTVGIGELARVSRTLANGCWSDLFDLAADLLDSGADVRQLLVAMQNHLRDLSLLEAGGKQAAKELGPERVSLLKDLKGSFTVETLMEMSRELSSAEKELRTSNLHRWILERTLARMQSIAHGRADRSEIRTPGAVMREPDRARKETPVPPASLTATPVPMPPLPTRNTPAPEVDEVDETDYDEAEAPVTGLSEAPLSIAATQVMPDSTAPIFVEPARSYGESSVVTSEPAAMAATSGSRFAEEISLEVIRRSWERIKALVNKVSPPAGIYLEKAEVFALDGKLVTLRFQDDFARNRIQSKGKELAERKLNEGLKTEGYRIQCLLEGSSGGAAQGSASSSPGGTVTGASVMETGTLLDAPRTPDTKPTRMMDFDLGTPPPQSAPPAQEAAERPMEAPGQSLVAPTLVPDPMTGMLKETLDIFGGTVVRSEPIG